MSRQHLNAQTICLMRSWNQFANLDCAAGNSHLFYPLGREEFTPLRVTTSCPYG